MAATSSSAIRDTMSAALKALTPGANGEAKFREHDNRSMLGFEFQQWCEKSPQAAFRRFLVRSDGNPRMTGASNTDADWVETAMEVTVAYPRDHRYGPQQKLDLDDTIEQDAKRIRWAVGVNGYAAIAAADGTVLEPETTIRVEGDACFFTVVTIPIGYWEARPT